MSHTFWNAQTEQHFSPPGNHRDYLEALHRASGIPAHRIGKTLDIGCNRAWAAGLFDDYYGVDSNPLAIQSAQQYWAQKRKLDRPEERFKLIGHESKQLPYPDATFDLVFAKDVLEHLKDPVAAVQDFARVLKPGGLLFLCTPDAQPWMWSDPTHIRPYPRAAHVALAHLAGLSLLMLDFESVMPGTQRVARTFGRGRSPWPLRWITRHVPFWSRNVWSVLKKESPLQQLT